MSLRNQVALLLVALSVVLVAVTYGVQVVVVMPTFAELEQQSARRDMSRCMDAISRDLEALSNFSRDWASWDDTYQFIVDHNEEYMRANLSGETFTNANLHVICLVDNNRKIVWGEMRDPETLEKMDAPDFFRMVTDASGPFPRHQHVDDTRKGLVLTSQGPLLVAASPITLTTRQGAVRGSVIMGRLLNSAELTALSERIHMTLRTWNLQETDLPADARRGLAQWSGGDAPILDAVDKNLLCVYSVVKDMSEQPALLLRIDLPRDITARGHIAAYTATGCSVVGSLLTLLGVWSVLKWRVVGPVVRMADHAVRVGKQDDLKARLQLDRGDEIGTLAREFDTMVGHLAESRKKVLDSAHRAGMAEIASEVLHNVGNAVNSANCCVEMLDERLRNSKLSGLDRAANLLQEQASRAAEFFGQDPRGPKLIDYLITLSKSLHQERSANEDELKRLRETIRHIRDAITSQQTFAGRSDFRQEVDLQLLLEEAIQLNQEALRAAEVQVETDIPPLPELQLNKSKMIQVLVNLLRNAIHAMQNQPSDARRLSLAARLVDEVDLEIEVRDTGCGFDECVREKLFTHGFTTKPEGNGFGLHYCANAVREAGGHITALSPGPGQGATFRIRLPQVVSLATVTG